MKSVNSFLCFILAFYFFGCSKDNPVINQPIEIKWEKLVANRDVMGIAVNSKGYIYAGVYEPNGINKIIFSKDGISWDSTIVAIKNYSFIWSIYINKKDEIFISIYGYGPFVGKCGLFYSADDGKNWTDISPKPGSDFRRMLSVGDKFFISSQFHDESPGGIYYTTNYGENWTTSFWQRNKGNGSLILLNDNTLMDVKSDSLMISADGGQSWSFKKGLIDSAYIRALEADIFGNVYASTYKGIYRSGDKGTSWIKTGLSNLAISLLKSTSGGFLFVSEGLYNYENPQGIYFTSDRGLSWAECNDGLTDKLIQTIAVDKQGYVYAGTGTGIFKTTKTVK